MKKSKEACAGCYDNGYNYGLGGAKECWKFKSAKIVPRLLIHVDRPPPYKEKPTKMMSCYKKPRYCTVDPKALGADGFWRY